MFYITAIPYIGLKYLGGELSAVPLLGDLIFMQNYVSNWAYLYEPGWSLAVEEHFNLGLAGVLFLTSRSKGFKYAISCTDRWFDRIVKAVSCVLILCLLLRLFGALVLEVPNTELFSQTHFRIDSLVAGVLLSYLYYFKKEKLTKFYDQNRTVLIVVAVIGVSWAPFINPIPSVFVKTIGFTLLYASFSIGLSGFVLEGDINGKLNRILSGRVVDTIAHVGFSSYAIYIIHTLVNDLTAVVCRIAGFHLNSYVMLLLTSVISILAGIFLTKTIEDFSCD